MVPNCDVSLRSCEFQANSYECVHAAEKCFKEVNANMCILNSFRSPQGELFYKPIVLSPARLTIENSTNLFFAVLQLTNFVDFVRVVGGQDEPLVVIIDHSTVTHIKIAQEFDRKFRQRLNHAQIVSIFKVEEKSFADRLKMFLGIPIKIALLGDNTFINSALHAIRSLRDRKRPPFENWGAACFLPFLDGTIAQKFGKFAP